jgi:hypothetical protein
MPIYNLNNTDFEDYQDDDPDAYYIKSHKSSCTKVDFYVAIFNIVIVSLIFNYLQK